MIDIKRNLKIVREKIAEACAKSGRKPEEVMILAVTKTVPPERIREAYNLGIVTFGENRVQEAREKIEKLKDLDIKWHMIGHLQTNKVKYAVNLFTYIESVDREKLVLELSKRLKKLNKVMPILVEVNLGYEESKSGVLPEKLFDLIKLISEHKNLKLKGLMTVPPYFEDPEKVRPYFQRLRELLETINSKNLYPEKLKELSMGMSNDYPIAVEEGATIVRIGTAIFGPRRY